MKNIFILSISFLALFFAACTKEVTVSSTVETVTMTQYTAQIAKVIAGLSGNLLLTQEVFKEVSNNEAKLQDEQIAFDEFSKSNQKFITTLKNKLSPELLNFITNNSLEIYWPYSENWDGKIAPTITFQPINSITENIGFVKEGNILRQVLVNKAYAETHPVWIIKAKEIIEYSSRAGDIEDTPTANTRIIATPVATPTRYTFKIKKITLDPYLYEATGSKQFFDNRAYRAVLFTHYQVWESYLNNKSILKNSVDFVSVLISLSDAIKKKPIVTDLAFGIVNNAPSARPIINSISINALKGYSQSLPLSISIPYYSTAAPLSIFSTSISNTVKFQTSPTIKDKFETQNIGFKSAFSRRYPKSTNDFSYSGSMVFTGGVDFLWSDTYYNSDIVPTYSKLHSDTGIITIGFYGILEPKL